MKNFRFDLTLFSQGGETSGCAAEQSDAPGMPTVHEAAENESIISEAAVAPESAGTSEAPRTPVPTPPERNDDELLAEALGIDETDRDCLLGLIRSRRERGEMLSMLREKSAVREYKKLSDEAERLTSAIPGFDLSRELSDRRFSAMVNSGLSLEEAFRAVHFDEIMESALESAVKNAQMRAMKTVSEFSSRPDENGSGGHAPAHTAPDVKTLTGKGIRDILRRVEKGAKVKF